ncbi:MAG: MoaD/ThiS family protein [Candidatus Dormibacteria bacterium]
MSETSVRVLLFASMRQLIGRSALELELGRDVRSVQACWEALCREHPQLSPHRANVRPALNRVYVGWDEDVSAGDELAFIPPVSGGAR